MSLLFSPVAVGPVEARNRLWMSPMCMYSAEPAGVDAGKPTWFHHQHYVSRSVGGVGAVVVEATAVTPEGRLSPFDLTLHSDDHLEEWAQLAEGIARGGALAGIQLAHAGRKASGPRPWEPDARYFPDHEIGWQGIAPSALALSDVYAEPREMTQADIERTVADFAAATRRAVDTGFELIEIHGAHGYLVHQFLSPLSNQRSDDYGGSLENRIRFPLEVIDAVVEAAAGKAAVSIRVSASDWHEDMSGAGWTVEETIAFINKAAGRGIHAVDVSSGGNSLDVRIPARPGYQVPFARTVREGTGIVTSTVGLIVDAAQAEQCIVDGSADIVSVGRVLLSDPYVAQAWRTRLRDQPDPAQPYHRQTPRV